MTYCRWSSMNWMCDVYVYEDVSGGWTTHVAGRRRVIPPIPDIPITAIPKLGATWDMEARTAVYPSRAHKVLRSAFFRIWALWHKWVHGASMAIIPIRNIGLAYDGESFNDPSAEDCADRLEFLREAGYIVPQYAIDALREESEDD